MFEMGILQDTIESHACHEMQEAELCLSLQHMRLGTRPTAEGGRPDAVHEVRRAGNID